MIQTIIITILAGIIIAWLLSRKYNKTINELNKELKKYKFGIRSAYVKFGKSFENFVPFINNFPGDRDKTVFLGMPIDLISFDEDTIKFIEVKTGNSQLSHKQKFIRNQIEQGKVEFKEVRY